MLRHPVEGSKYPKSPLIQIFFNHIPAGAFCHITFGPILACEKPAGQRKVTDHSQTFFPAEGFEFFFVVGTIIEIEQRLQALISGVSFVFADLQRLSESVGGIVRRPYGPDL